MLRIQRKKINFFGSEISFIYLRLLVRMIPSVLTKPTSQLQRPFAIHSTNPNMSKLTVRHVFPQYETIQADGI